MQDEHDEYFSNGCIYDVEAEHSQKLSKWISSTDEVRTKTNPVTGCKEVF